jgi:hypothetical protein
LIVSAESVATAFRVTVWSSFRRAVPRLTVFNPPTLRAFVLRMS